MQKRLNKSQLKKPHNSYTYLIDNIIDNKEVRQISTTPQNSKALKDFDISIACCQARARSSTPNNGVGGHGEVLNGAVETIKEEEEEEEVENGHVGNGV